jgi:hypothetical protein
MIKKISLAALTFSLLATQVSAGETHVGLGLSNVDSKNKFTTIEGSSVSVSDINFSHQMLNLRLGYDFTEYYGIDIRYSLGVNEDTHVFSGDLFKSAVSVDSIGSLMFNVKTPEYLGFIGRVSLGPTILSESVGRYKFKESGFGLGVGVNYIVDNDMQISLEYMSYGSLTGYEESTKTVKSESEDTSDTNVATRTGYTAKNSSINLSINYSF